MSIYETGFALLMPNDFWHFQAKDAVTALIALAAFLTAATNVWVAYLRRHKLHCEVGDVLRIGYSAAPHHELLFRMDIVAMNVGAQPGIVKRLAIRIAGAGSTIDLHWNEVLKTENIATKGQRGVIWTDFAGFAAPVLVPKYDARLIDAGFWSRGTCRLSADTDYRFRLVYWTAGRKKPLFGAEKTLRLDHNQIALLETKGTTNEKGIRERYLSLTSIDGNFFGPLQPSGE